MEIAQELQDIEDEEALYELAIQLRQWEEEDELTSLLQQWDEEDHFQKLRDKQGVLDWCEQEEIQDLASYVEENYGAESCYYFQYIGSWVLYEKFNLSNYVMYGSY
jgi:hypothetical protein